MCGFELFFGKEVDFDVDVIEQIGSVLFSVLIGGECFGLLTDMNLTYDDLDYFLDVVTELDCQFYLLLTS